MYGSFLICALRLIIYNYIKELACETAALGRQYHVYSNKQTEESERVTVSKKKNTLISTIEQ